jgi:hypothetical protein
MQRRDVLKLLTSAAALSAVPLDLILTLQQAHAQTSHAGSLRTLNSHQNATVTALTELIIPATDVPGAKGAKVNEFIDLLLTEWFDESDAKHFLMGLAQVDAESRKSFGADFIDCNPSQQARQMKQMDDGAMAYARTQRLAGESQTPPPPSNFFYTLKKLTLVGYYTSEIGFEKELGKSIIPPGHDGCAPLQEARR